MGGQTPRWAADTAAVAALLQIAAELGIDRVLDSGAEFTAADLANTAGVPLPAVTEYLTALVAADLVVTAGDRYRVVDDYADRRYESGYLSWTMVANAPFLGNARQFLVDRAAAAGIHHRDGRRVAVSSRWIGDKAFYPLITERVTTAGALRVSDLGAGAGGLIVDLLRDNTARTGVALDINPAACRAAREAAVAAGVADRLDVVERPIESLVDDPGPIAGADTVLASFVIHDIVNDEPLAKAVLGAVREALAPGGFLVVADAVAYASDPAERAFSALFTYLHAAFMGIKLPTEQQWHDTFHTAGFATTETVTLGVPGGRLFVAAR